MGLYWRKGNAHGALASIVIGVSSYIIFHVFWPNPLGMHTVVLPVLLALLGYVAFSLGSGLPYKVTTPK